MALVLGHPPQSHLPRWVHSQDGFTFYWPAASDQGANNQVLASYEYKTGAAEGAFSDWLRVISGRGTGYHRQWYYCLPRSLQTFFVRTADNAGNVLLLLPTLASHPLLQRLSSYSATKCGHYPETTSDSQQLKTSFLWLGTNQHPTAVSCLKYYYCVNCTPSADTMTKPPVVRQQTEN